jgi:hypothetical protein
MQWTWAAANYRLGAKRVDLIHHKTVPLAGQTAETQFVDSNQQIDERQLSRRSGLA